ncbi:MAG: hypothetical protein ACRDZU_10725 [Acidimicrobiales bacterium]
MTGFLTDIKTLRERARAKIEEGPITSSYGADREQVIETTCSASWPTWRRRARYPG